jgi:hypothetical protein
MIFDAHLLKENDISTSIYVIFILLVWKYQILMHKIKLKFDIFVPNSVEIAFIDAEITLTFTKWRKFSS